MACSAPWPAFPDHLLALSILVRHPSRFEQVERFGPVELINLLGVVVGGVIGIAGSLLPHVWELRRARVSARAMARAYVSGILKMEEVRQHGALYRTALAGLQAGQPQSLPRVYGAEDTDDELQKQLINHLGHLGHAEATDLVHFCNMLAGLRIDLKAIALGQMDQLTIQQKIGVLERDLKLWEETLQLGHDLAQRLLK
jgi:hypothetical protein